MANDKVARGIGISAFGLGLLAHFENSNTAAQQFKIQNATPPGSIPIIIGDGNLALMTPNGAPGQATLRPILVPDLAKGIAGAAGSTLITPAGAAGPLGFRRLTLADVPIPQQVIGLGGGTDGPMLSYGSDFTGGQRYLVGEFTSPNGNGRIYFDLISGMEVTYNCVWDNVTALWSKDQPGISAFRNSFGNQTRDSWKFAADDVPWADNNFSAETLVLQGTVSQSRVESGFNQTRVHFVLSNPAANLGDVLRGVVSFGSEFLNLSAGFPNVTISNIFSSSGIDLISIAFSEINGFGCMVQATVDAIGPIPVWVHGDCDVTAS